MILLTAVLMKEKFNYMLVTYLLSNCDYLKEPIYISLHSLKTFISLINFSKCIWVSFLMSGYRRRCHYIVRHSSHPTLQPHLHSPPLPTSR